MGIDITIYISFSAGSLNDLTCGAINPVTGGEIRNIGISTELLVVLDTSWPYRDIVQILS